MTSPKTRAYLLVPVVVSWFACRGATDPQHGETFVLQSIGGNDLPAFVERDRVQWTILADTIWFPTSDAWRRHAVQIRGLPGVAEQHIDHEAHGVVRRDGVDLVLDFVCEDGASCAPPDRARRDGNRLLLDHTFLHGGTNLTFERR